MQLRRSYFLSRTTMAGAVLLVAASGLVACGKTEGPTLMKGAFVGVPTMIAPDVYAVNASSVADPDSLTAAARMQCEGKQICQVMVWAEGAAKPTAMPMLSSEASSIILNYQLNRFSDLDRARWDCERWPGADDSCLADLTE